jgi:hypothetical protein
MGLVAVFLVWYRELPTFSSLIPLRILNWGTRTTDLIGGVLRGMELVESELQLNEHARNPVAARPFPNQHNDPPSYTTKKYGKN